MPTHEQEQAGAIVEEVVGWQAGDAEAVAQPHPEQVQDGRAQQGGHVHEGVEQGECKPPAACAACQQMTRFAHCPHAREADYLLRTAELPHSRRRMTERMQSPCSRRSISGDDMCLCRYGMQIARMLADK